MNNLIKASCMAVVLNFGYRNEPFIIHHEGGIIGEVNIWLEEMDNSLHIEDIFSDYAMPPDKPGFYVWEGMLEYVFDDQPIFDGLWRKATEKDMVSLINTDVKYPDCVGCKNEAKKICFHCERL